MADGKEVPSEEIAREDAVRSRHSVGEVSLEGRSRPRLAGSGFRCDR